MEKKYRHYSRPLVLVVGAAAVFMLLASCVGTGSGQLGAGEPDSEDRARETFEQWQECRHTRDLDRYMTFFWDDALKVFGNPEGVTDLFRGTAEIRGDMEYVFTELGEIFANYTYPPAEYRFDEVTGLGELVFSLENPCYKEALRFEERKGEVKIAEHWIFYRFFYEHETSELSAWADEEGNGDGILNEEEQTRLFIAAYRVMFEAHEVDTPLAEFFDWNFDGFLDEKENDIARRVLLRNRFRRIDRLYPELTRHRLPPYDRDDLMMSMHDANWTEAAVSWPVDFFPQGPIEDHFHHVADINEDGLISPLDYEFYRDVILRVAAVNPAPVLYTREMPAFIDDIYHWSDQDTNGEVNDEELQQAGFELFDTFNWKSEFTAWTPIVRFFDRNRDGIIQEPEREWALLFVTDFLLPIAMEEGVVVENWNTGGRTAFRFDLDGSPELSDAEREELRSFITGFNDEFETEEDAEKTERRWLDSNGNDVVEMWEVDLFRDMLFGAVLRTWFLLPPEEANSILVRSALDATADTDGNGLLSMAEREELIVSLTIEHEAQSSFDGEIDSNSDGWISMEEIFRARDTAHIASGGVAGKRRIAELGTPRTEAAHRTETEAGTEAVSNRTAARVKAVSTWGSNLAVLGVRDLTEKMAPPQTSLLISFLENAFVNYGNVSVVDRQNLEKIMEEYQYQTSALVNEETAVEIGKLSGADAIAIGNLSLLAGTYYLHIKVVNVQSGKIIGSSISEGGSEKDFLGMCNQAVEPLF